MQKSKIKILVLVFLFLFFPQKTLAAVNVSITSFPQSVIAGQEFDVSFSASGLTPETKYNAKALGGNNFTEVDTWNFAWLQQNASWSSMPEFSSNQEGSASATIKARFDPSTTSGSKEFKARIRKLGVDPYYDSLIVNISVTEVTPTPMPTPTQAPTAEPTSTPTPTPTASPTKTPTPTPIKTKFPSPTPTSEETATPESLVLGLQEETASPTAIATAEAKGKFPLLSVIFILGGLVCIGGAIVGIMKKKNEKVPENS